MRVILTSLVLCIVFCAIGCNKPGEEPKVILGAESWRYYEVTYQKLASKWTKRRRNNSYTDSLVVLNFTATDTTGLLSFSFTEKPVAGKRYQVVYESATADQVCIDATGGAGHGHAGSQDDAGKFLNVTNENGKLHFFIEQVELEVYTMVSNYNVDCSINLTE